MILRMVKGTRDLSAKHLEEKSVVGVVPGSGMQEVKRGWGEGSRLSHVVWLWMERQPGRRSKDNPKTKHWRVCHWHVSFLSDYLFSGQKWAYHPIRTTSLEKDPQIKCFQRGEVRLDRSNWYIARRFHDSVLFVDLPAGGVWGGCGRAGRSGVRTSQERTLLLSHWDGLTKFLFALCSLLLAWWSM